MNKHERKTYELDIAQYDNDELLAALFNRPMEGLVLRCTSDRRIDLGSICYADRTYKYNKSPKPVDVFSYKTNRSEKLRTWCTEHIFKARSGGSNYTLYQSATEFTTHADWCDTNGHRDFLEDEFSYKRALDSYTQHLILTMQQGGIKGFRATRLQSAAIHNGNLFYPEARINFLSDMPILSSSSAHEEDREKTPTPSENEMAAHLTACQYLFDGITDFLVEGLPYPHRIAYLDTEALLMPSEYSIITNAILEARWKPRNSIVWDYTNGAIRTVDEMLARTNQTRAALIGQEIEARKFLEEANNDIHHRTRKWLGNFAQQAFYSLFTANTAMNESQMRRLFWAPSYESSNSDSAGFVTIKFRAGNMEQSFDIKKSFTKHFNKFLKLRNYLCEGRMYDYMFLHYSSGQYKNIPIRASTVWVFNEQMVRFVDPDYHGVTHRALRKYKSIFLLSHNYPVGVVSAVLQNSTQTILKNYSESEEKTAIDEISSTLSYVISILGRDAEIDVPGGSCSGDESSPLEIAPESYEPNCKNFVGCIYCKEFRLHANEDSIRKLLSMRYVTMQRVTACTDLDEFRALHGEAIERIDTILRDLTVVRPEMEPIIERVRLEIADHQLLSPYWETFYHRLLKLKVIK